MTPQTADIKRKVEQLSAIRGESERIVLERFGEQRIHKNAPRSFPKFAGQLHEIGFVASGVENSMAFVVLENGRKFYGHVSAPSHEKAYPFIQDIIPQCICPEALILAQDILFRLKKSQNWPPEDMVPPPGGTVIECGGYLGHKSIRFIDDFLGPGGQVFAFELMPENYQILQKNIAENGLQHQVYAENIGIWHEKDSLKVRSKGRQRSSIANMERLGEQTETQVPVESIGSIVRRLEIDRVDFMLVTVNGAEVEVLNGIGDAASKIRSLLIATLYTPDGRDNNTACTNWLLEQGFLIHQRSNTSRVCAYRPGSER